MDDRTLMLLGGALVAVLALAVLGLLVLLLRERRAATAERAEVRAETRELRTRLDHLGEAAQHQKSQHRTAQHARSRTGGEVEFLITDAGEVLEAADLRPVPDRLVLSATLGEPLVKAMALGHGLRRALSADARDRMRLEIRREVRRSRKERRREMREAWRASRAEAARDAA